MYRVNSIRVIDNIQQWIPNSDKATNMMDNTGCYKTFVKLYLLSNDYPRPVYSDTIRDTILQAMHDVDEEGKYLLKTMLYVKLFHAISTLWYNKGPALTHTDSKRFGAEIDTVFCLLFSPFPREALIWKKRQSQLTLSNISGAIIECATYCYLVGEGNNKICTSETLNGGCLSLTLRINSFSHGTTCCTSVT